jgi:hypothetical protein
MGFNQKRFDAICKEIGALYAEMRNSMNEGDALIPPNDHIVGSIGEWHAVKLLKRHGLTVEPASHKANDPDDFIIYRDGRRHFISVKTITAHSKSGVAGLGFKGNWEWKLVMLLGENLTVDDFFWISRRDCQRIFGDSGRFVLKRTEGYRSKCPVWFNHQSRKKKRVA